MLKAAGPPILLAAILVAIPILGDDFLAYEVALYLIYGIVAQGIALTWGRCGILSLGQALFFGMGAYLAGFVLIATQSKPIAWLLLPLAIAVPAALAWAIARVLFARRFENGPYFSLITLAMGMLGFQLVNQWAGVTGGFNGLSGIPELPMLDRYETMYWLISVVCVASTAAFAWLNRTPMGTLWQAISDNENRLQFFGFATDRLKAWAFAISAGAAGLAGLLFAPYQGLVTPQTMSFQLSAELVIWTAVGGRYSPSGALLGTVAIGLLSASLREHLPYWEVIVAAVFIVVVLRFPGGMLAACHELWSLLPARRARSETTGSVVLQSSKSSAPKRRGVDKQARLEFDEVSVSQRGVRILQGLSLRIDTPGIHGIIGPNGAGKTSSFNVLTGRLPLSSGSIRWNDGPIARQTADAIARLGIGRKFQIPSTFNSLTVEQNLSIALWAQRAQWQDLLRMPTHAWSTPLADDLLGKLPFLRLQGRLHAGALSQGQRQMLELAMTLLPEPRLMLLDEPCAGLSAQETALQMRMIKESVARSGATALLIEHDMKAIEALADQVHVLHQGRVLASGTYEAIKGNRHVREVYAGGSK